MERASNMLAIETFGDLFKKDLIEAGSIYAHQALWTLDISPYLSVLFKRGLKRGEAQETAKPILKEGMMFTSMVGVELTNKMVDINQRMDDFKVEVKSERERKERAEVVLRQRIKREEMERVRVSYRVEILEEARRRTWQVLESFTNKRRLETVRVRSIRAHCSILKS